MSYDNIKVIAYSGYRGNEGPRALLINDKIITVVEIVDKWIEENFSDRTRNVPSFLKRGKGRLLNNIS